MTVNLAEYLRGAGLYMALFVPVISFFVSRFYIGGPTTIMRYLLVIAISSVSIVGLIVGGWLVLDAALEYTVSFLDRNGDGVWTRIETETWTEEEWRAYNLYIGDGGRNVFALFSPVLGVAYSTLVMLGLSIGDSLTKAVRVRFGGDV